MYAQRFRNIKGLATSFLGAAALLASTASALPCVDCQVSSGAGRWVHTSKTGYWSNRSVADGNGKIVEHEETQNVSNLSAFVQEAGRNRAEDGSSKRTWSSSSWRMTSGSDGRSRSATSQSSGREDLYFKTDRWLPRNTNPMYGYWGSYYLKWKNEQCPGANGEDCDQQSGVDDSGQNLYYRASIGRPGFGGYEYVCNLDDSRDHDPYYNDGTTTSWETFFNYGYESYTRQIDVAFPIEGTNPPGTVPWVHWMTSITDYPRDGSTPVTKTIFGSAPIARQADSFPGTNAAKLAQSLPRGTCRVWSALWSIEYLPPPPPRSGNNGLISAASAQPQPRIDPLDALMIPGRINPETGYLYGLDRPGIPVETDRDVWIRNEWDKYYFRQGFAAALSSFEQELARIAEWGALFLSQYNRTVPPGNDVELCKGYPSLYDCRAANETLPGFPSYAPRPKASPSPSPSGAYGR